MENGRQQKERNRERVPNRATLDHSVASYNAQGSQVSLFFLRSPDREELWKIREGVTSFMRYLNIHLHQLKVEQADTNQGALSPQPLSLTNSPRDR